MGTCIDIWPIVCEKTGGPYLGADNHADRDDIDANKVGCSAPNQDSDADDGDDDVHDVTDACAGISTLP